MYVIAVLNVIPTRESEPLAICNSDQQPLFQQIGPECVPNEIGRCSLIHIKPTEVKKYPKVGCTSPLHRLRWNEDFMGETKELSRIRKKKNILPPAMEARFRSLT